MVIYLVFFSTCYVLAMLNGGTVLFDLDVYGDVVVLFVVHIFFFTLFFSSLKNFTYTFFAALCLF